MSMPTSTTNRSPADSSLATGNGRMPAEPGSGTGRYTRDAAPDETSLQLARALGWFSVGLGMAALIRPGRIAQMVGVPESGGNQALLRAIGLREIASGVGILTQQHPSIWLWARIGGDALDLAMLTRAMGDERADRGRVGVATAAVIGVTAVDAYATRQIARDQNGARHEPDRATASEPRVASAITVNAPVNEVFGAWEGFASLPHFMDSFATVRVTDERLSHWQASLPGGLSVSWDTLIIEVSPNERIGWRTGDNSTVTGSGEVQFRPAPGNRGTEILFSAEFAPPGGELGSKVAGLFTDPLGVKLNNDLRRFKQLTELGEIVKSDDAIVPGPNPAQPVPEGTAT